MRKMFYVGALAVGTGIWFLERLGRRWGATDEEVHQSLPGDALIPHPMLETTHGITIQATAARIWPWLVQMGYYRAGWYATEHWYDDVAETILWSLQTSEERVGYGRRLTPSADRIMPEFQDLKVGDIIPEGAPDTAYFIVAALEPERLLAYRSTTHLLYALPHAIRTNPKLALYGDFTWAFILRERADNTSRLILRTRVNAGPRLFRAIAFRLLLPADFFMARRTLRGIKQRVEQAEKQVERKEEYPKQVALPS